MGDSKTVTEWTKREWASVSMEKDKKTWSYLNVGLLHLQECGDAVSYAILNTANGSLWTSNGRCNIRRSDVSVSGKRVIVFQSIECVTFMGHCIIDPFIQMKTDVLVIFVNVSIRLTLDVIVAVEVAALHDSSQWIDAFAICGKQMVKIIVYGITSMV